MTAEDLTRFQLNDVGYQLEKAVEGVSDANWNSKLTPEAMSPADTFEHLCESYEALIASSKGEKWEWGSFSAPDKSKSALLDTFRKTRERAILAALDGADAERLQHVFIYITAHDAYHVGQLCLANVVWTPDWDPYSIYNY